MSRIDGSPYDEPNKARTYSQYEFEVALRTQVAESIKAIKANKNEILGELKIAKGKLRAAEERISRFEELAGALT